MRIYKNTPQETTVSDAKDFIIWLAESSFSRKSFFQMHFPFALLIFGLMLWFFSISFASEYQWIYHNIGGKSKIITLLLCFGVELAKFIVMGLMWTFWRFKEFTRFIAALVVTVGISYGSYFMSINGTGKLALSEIGTAPQNTVLSDNKSVFAPMLKSLNENIESENKIIAKTGDWEKFTGAVRWAKNSKWVLATSKLKIYEAQKRELESKYTSQIVSGQEHHSKQVAQYDKNLANFGEFLEYKVAITEPLNQLCGAYISWFLWIVLTGGRGLKGYEELLAQNSSEIAEELSEEKENSHAYNSIQDIKQEETASIPIVAEEKKISPTYKDIPRIETEKTTFKESLAEGKENSPTYSNIQGTNPQNSESDFPKVSESLGKSAGKTYKEMILNIWKYSPNISKEGIIDITSITEGHFTKTMQYFVIQKAKTENIPVHRFQEKNHLLSSFHLNTSFKELDNLAALLQEKEKNQPNSRGIAEELSEEKTNSPTYNSIPRTNQEEIHEVEEEIALTIEKLNGKPKNGIQKLINW